MSHTSSLPLLALHSCQWYTSLGYIMPPRLSFTSILFPSLSSFVMPLSAYPFQLLLFIFLFFLLFYSSPVLSCLCLSFSMTIIHFSFSFILFPFYISLSSFFLSLFLSCFNPFHLQLLDLHNHDSRTVYSISTSSQFIFCSTVLSSCSLQSHLP